MPVVGVDHSGCVWRAGEEDRLLAVSGDEHIEMLYELLPGAAGAASNAASLLALQCRMRQCHMRAAENQPGVGPHRADRIGNFDRGRQLGRRRDHAEMVDTGAAGVVGDSVDEIRIARQIEHFDIAAARLDRGRDLEDAKRHEHPLVEQERRRWNDQADPGGIGQHDAFLHAYATFDRAAAAGTVSAGTT